MRVEQEDKLVVLASCWFVEGKLMGTPASGAPGARTRVVPAPESCTEIPWVAEVAPILKGFHARSADYPLSIDEFESDYRDGGNSMSLWAVPENAGTDAMAGRLADTSGELSVMSADLIGRDGNVRATGASQCRIYRPRP